MMISHQVSYCMRIGTIKTRLQRFNQYWHFWIERQFPRLELTPLRIALIYTAFGLGALYFSDVYLVRHLSEPRLSQFQAAKGGLEVFATAALIFLLTARSRGQLQAANTRLRRRTDELNLFHRVFRHNLRNDLNIVDGYAKMLQRDLTTEPSKSKCETILKTTERIYQYIERARQIREVTERTTRTEIDLAERIPHLLRDHPKITDAITVTTTIPETASVEVNPLFEEAFKEVVTNAIKHNDSSAPVIHIEVAPNEAPVGLTTLRITDNGPGIPPKEFDALRAPVDQQVYHSTGMGIWFIDWVVRHSDGELTIQRTEPTGTEVNIDIPTSRLFSRSAIYL